MPLSENFRHEYYSFPRGIIYYYRNVRSGFASTLEAICAAAVQEGIFEKELLGDIIPVRARFLVRDGKVPENGLTYTIVRNPYRRLATVYAYGILLERFCNLETREGQRYERFGFHAKTDFGDFVRAVVTIPADEADDFIGPQVHRIFDDGRKRARYIAKLERIQEDWETLIRIYGIEIPFPHRGKTRHNDPVYWTEELRDLVYDYYQDDFLVLGYEHESIPVNGDHPPSGITVRPESYHLDPLIIEQYSDQVLRDNQDVRAEAEAIPLPRRNERQAGDK